MRLTTSQLGGIRLARCVSAQRAVNAPVHRVTRVPRRPNGRYLNGFGFNGSHLGEMAMTGGSASWGDEYLDFRTHQDAYVWLAERLRDALRFVSDGHPERAIAVAREINRFAPALTSSERGEYVSAGGMVQDYADLYSVAARGQSEGDGIRFDAAAIAMEAKIQRVDALAAGREPGQIDRTLDYQYQQLAERAEDLNLAEEEKQEVYNIMAAGSDGAADAAKRAANALGYTFNVVVDTGLGALKLGIFGLLALAAARATRLI